MDLVARRSDREGAAQLLVHVGALVLAEWWLLRSSGLLRVVAIVVAGVLLVFLFCAAHECIHRTAFRHRAIDDAVAAIIGVALVLPSRWFRFFHAAHHRWTQDPDLDPELAGPTPSTRMSLVLRLSGAGYWWSMSGVVLRLARGRADGRWIPVGHRRGVIREARWVLALYVAIAAVSALLRSTLALETWVLPALVGQPFLRAYLLAEHAGCPVGRGPVAGTRTTTTNALVRRLAWNMPFHAEHHAHPQVPFHQLPALHAAGAASGAVTGRGYLRTVAALVAAGPQGLRTDAGRRA